MKIEPFLGLELILTTSDYLERNFCNKILIFFIMDLPTDIKFIILNVLIHFRGSVPFEVHVLDFGRPSISGSIRSIKMYS